MGIVEDIKGDKRTKTVLDQTNTKTVGPPPSSTGLIGDQLPDTVFAAGDFDLVKNQVNLEANNFQLLESLNTMGQITNMQSQSGPMPGTSKIVTVTDTTGSGSPRVTLLQPDAGQVWLFYGAQTGGSLNANAAQIKLYDGNTTIKIASETASATTFDPVAQGPIYVTNEVYMVMDFVSATGTCNGQAAFVRVR